MLSVLAIGLAWCTTVFAQAQPAPARSAAEAPAAAQPSVYPPVWAVGLLTMPSIQVELRMTTGQKQQFRTLYDQFNQANQPDIAAANQLQQSESQPGAEAKFNEIQQRMYQRSQRYERQVQQVLEPAQWSQLHQIAFHLSVTQALGIPQIAQQIRLTTEQRQQIQQIQYAAADKFFQIQRQVAEQLFQSLSPQQQQMLQSLNIQALRGGGR
jgi:hypothetical protein